jgi:hypothetical protein
LEDLIIEVSFKECTKKFGMKYAVTSSKSVYLKDPTIVDKYRLAFVLHIDLSKKRLESEVVEVYQNREATRKAELEKNAEERYLKTKERLLKEFEKMSTRETENNFNTNEFYYALGWLASHVGSMTAILPDYLGNAFEKHFGTETPKTLVNSRAKTSGGYAKQWSWEFKCTIKKLNQTTVPACIRNITTDFAKGIHNTSFIWDLVDNHGFQFGRKQDIEKIKQTIPNQFISSFEIGLAA